MELAEIMNIRSLLKKINKQDFIKETLQQSEKIEIIFLQSLHPWHHEAHFLGA